MNQKEIQKHEETRLDGWQNILTNLRVEGADKRSGLMMKHRFLRQIEVESFYHGDDIAEKACDILPEDMMREGFTVTSSDYDDLDDDVQEWFEEFGLYDKIEQGLKWARLYGGAGLLLGMVDGGSPEMALNMDKVRGIEFATILHRYDFAPSSSQMIDKDVTSNNYGLPKYYKLSPVLGQGKKINSETRNHFSRIIRFTGAPVQGKDKPLVNWWGDSILSKLWNVITNYQTSHDNAALIMEDVTKMVVKLNGLRDILALGKEGDDLIERRLRLIQKVYSVVNAVIVEQGEEAETKTTSVAGIPDMLKLINARLCTALGIPHTILLGESPSGLGATGNSEKQDWFEQVRKRQESILRPILKRLINIFLATQKKKDVEFTVVFNPLSLPTEKEQAETRKTQSETDCAYIDRGVLYAEEVAESRFGSGTYSLETTIDKKARKEIDNQVEVPEDDAAKTAA